MKIEVLSPDTPLVPPSHATSPSAFASALDAVGSLLDDAQSAEDAYAGGGGSLQNAVYERARADVALSVATAAASRATQALQSILNMQV